MPPDSEVTKETNTGFDWQSCWYPMAFEVDLPASRPVRVTLWDEGIVLFRDGDGVIAALRDMCPHRSARLSDGQIRDGRLECLYHGWQYDRSGDCQFIPQMLPGKDYPIRSCVRAYPLSVVDGIIWLWPGSPETADENLIPASQGRGVAGLHEVTFQMDLPYDHSYLIENVIDIAHIHIAHDGVRGGGHREAAKPLEFEIEESGPEGIQARFRSFGLKRAGRAAKVRGARVEYQAPHMVRYASDYLDKSLAAGLELYALPSGRGRCRLLYRKYANFTGWRERIKPRWMEHQTQCLILEQDMNVVTGQHAEIEAAGSSLRALWLPIKSSDRLVIEYRRWFDRYGQKLPFYRGFESEKDSISVPLGAHDRTSLHTAICPTCQRTARLIDQGKTMAAGFGLMAIAAAAAGAPMAYAIFGLASLATARGLAQLRQRF